MNVSRPVLSTLVASAGLIGIFALGALGTADASVQKCMAKDGSVTYTDGACGASASPMALPAGLARAVAANDTGEFGYDADGNAGAPIGLGPRTTQSGCSRSPEQLQADLGYAFASRDINRIAGNYHWVGLNQRDARGILDRLESMSRERVAETRYIDASLGSAFARATSTTAENAGFLQLALASGSPVQMKVARYHGCYFAQF